MSVDIRPPEQTLLFLNQSEWDVDEIVDDVTANMGESVPRSAVRQTIIALLANYEDARVKTFVPILVRRQALEIYRVR